MTNPAVILGAGPAGLAVAAELRRAGVPFILLEQSDQVAPAWRRHYDRLHLHTHKAFSALPGLPFPRAAPRYPARQQVVDYLTEYAAHFQLAPLFGQNVTAARPAPGGWHVETATDHWLTPHLIVATGYAREPVVPQWPGQAAFAGPIVHSADYRHGEPYREQRVLVVGFGNSGGELAIDLHERGAQPTLAVRSPVNVIPRELFGLPILAVSLLLRRLPPRLADALNAPILRLTLGDLRRYSLRPAAAGPLTQIQQTARIPLIDVGTLALIRQGHIAVRPGLERFTPHGVVFTGGAAEDFDAVILATGYRPRVSTFLQAGAGVYDAAGTPLSSGCAAPLPGLYFCGFYVSPTGMLREISREAQRLARLIARAAR